MAVCPLDQLVQALGVDSFCHDTDTNPVTERPSRYRVIHAEEAAVVRFAVDCQLKALQRDAEPAARIAITVASQLARAARASHPGEEQNSRHPHPLACP